MYGTFNPIPTGHGRNQPIYERHVTKSGRNRVNRVYRVALGLRVKILVDETRSAVREPCITGPVS